MMLAPTTTYILLLIVQAFHLLHHRLVKRHISFAEVVSAAVLCVPPFCRAASGVAFYRRASVVDSHSNCRELVDQEIIT